jgi:hypothetical protein
LIWREDEAGIFAVAVTAFLVGLFLAGSPASGHSSIIFYPDIWGIKNRIYWFEPDFPNGDARDRVQEAGNRWEDERPSGSTLAFNVGGGSDRLGWSGTDCTDRTSWDSVMWVQKGSGGFIARTLVCGSGGTFKIEINEDKGWFMGSGQNPGSLHHLLGYTTHEFGHATHGWDPNHFGQGQTANWDLAHICNDNDWPSVHTMCAGIPKQESWRFKTLESHDIATFQEAYQGQG